MLAGWSGLGLAVLALGESESQAPAIIEGTAHLFGVLTALWALARLLEEDDRSRLVVAAECTRAGVVGRLAGRWGGAVLTGSVVAALLAAGLGLFTASAPETTLRLLSTSICSVAHAGAWGLFLAGILPGPATVLGASLLWIAGHLPWGGPGWLEGAGGRAVGAMLPGPTSAIEPGSALLASAAATAALVLAALCIGARPRLRR